MVVKYVTPTGAPIPVRNNTPQQIGPYTFKDQNGNVISLAAYVSCTLELRQSGLPVVSLSATILTPASNGQVQYASYTFTETGIWQAQFYCTDGSGNKLYGEPLQFRVVENEDDAALTDPPLPY